MSITLTIDGTAHNISEEVSTLIQLISVERDKLKEESIQWEKESLVELIKERDELKEIATKYEDRYFSEKKITDELKAEAYTKKGYLYSDCLEQADAEIAELRAQLARCVVQRDEAMEWNWMDDDVPAEIVASCTADTEETASLDAAILNAAKEHGIENNKPKIFCNCSICKAVKARQEMK